MRMAARLAGDETPARDCVAIADLSCLDRAGIKGPERGAVAGEPAASPSPHAANAWTGLPGGGLIARLGRTEFFLEDGVTGDSASLVRDAPALEIAGVYPVIRQDAAHRGRRQTR